jgi:multiple sugar transport system substrate-binding protein
VPRNVRAAVSTAAILIAGALGLAACGGDDGAESAQGKAASAGAPATRGASLTMWTMPNSPDPKKDLEGLLEPFTAETGIKVKVQVVGWDVQLDRIRNASVSGDGPDVTQAGTTQVPFFAALGGFEDISKRVGEVGGKSAYAPGVYQTTQLAGRPGTWALPWFTEARAIYYRKDVLEKAGLDPATAFADWDALRSTLETIKAKVPEIDGQRIEPFGSPGKKAFDLVHHVMPFVWDAGGAELSPDAKTSAIASPQAAEGVRYVAGLLEDGLYDKTQLERDGTQVENQFKGGKLAVWIGGPWVLGTVDRKDDTIWSDAARKNVGVAAMPSGPSGKGYTFVGGSNLMMMKNASNKDAAWALMKYLAQADVQASYADKLGMFPARLDAQEKVGAKDANHEQFLKAIQQGRTYAPIPQWAQVENAYKTRLGNILDSAAGRGSQPLDDARLQSQLQAAAKEADGLLAQGAS